MEKRKREKGRNGSRYTRYLGALNIHFDWQLDIYNVQSYLADSSNG
jgi:hypothetical protein